MGSRHILMVDGAENFESFAAQVASGAGYTVTIAPDGRAFQRLYAAEKPGIVLLELMMPGFDGIEAVRWLCAQNGNPRIVVTSRATPFFNMARRMLADMCPRLDIAACVKPLAAGEFLKLIAPV